MNSIRLFERATHSPIAEATPLTISGNLPAGIAGEAYEGRIPFAGNIGDVVVDGWAGNLPSGATVTIDNASDELVVAWPPYQVADILVPAPIPNADFATAGDWQLGRGWSISGGVAFFNGHGDAPIVSETLFPVPAGRVISISCDVYQGASSEGSCGGAVRLAWFNAAREWLYNSEGNLIKTSEGGTLSSLTAAAPVDGYVAPSAWAFRRKQNKEMHVDNFAWNHYATVGGNSTGTFCLTAIIRDAGGRTADWAGCALVTVDPILDDAPDLYLPLTETSGATAFDISGNGHHATVGGNAARSAAGVVYNDNTGYFFVPYDPAIDPSQSGAFTLMALVRVTAADFGALILGHFEEPAITGRGTMINSGGSPAPFAFTAVQGTYGGGNGVSAGDILGSGVLCLLHAVRSGPDWKLYLNGAQVASGTAASGGASAPIHPIASGGYYYPGSYGWAGTIAHSALWRAQALSPARVLAHAQFLGMA